MRTFIVFAMTLWCWVAPAAEGAKKLERVKLALNWKPEPEFGGFYAAQMSGAYNKEGLDVAILPGGVGTPVVQMVASGKVEFGVVTSEEIVIARSRGADVVALFAVYQTSPEAIMAHEERGLKTLADVFQSGTVAFQKGLPSFQFLQSKFSIQAKIVPVLGGITQFLADPNLAQQCFITSEPIEARHRGSKAKVFLISEAGFDPYTTVVATRGDYLRKNPQIISSLRQVMQKGWAEYLKDPIAVNNKMHELNPSLNLKTFSEAAEAQRRFIESEETRSLGLGCMTKDRWSFLINQMKAIKLAEKTEPPAVYFDFPVKSK